MSTSVNPQQEKLIKKSHKDFSAKSEEITSTFVKTIEKADPQVAGMIRDHVSQFEKQLAETVKLVSQNATKLNTIEPQLVAFAQKFFGFGLTQEQFAVVCDTLVDTFAKVAGKSWNPQIDEAWRCAFQNVAQLVRQAHPVAQAA